MEMGTDERAALPNALAASTRRIIADKSVPAAIATQEGTDKNQEKAMMIAGVEQVELGTSWSCQSRVMCSNGQDNRTSLGECR